MKMTSQEVNRSVRLVPGGRTAFALMIAIAVGVFLSIASHALDWSANTTLVVGIAMVSIVALFGTPFLLLSVHFDPASADRERAVAPSSLDRSPDIANVVLFVPSSVLHDLHSNRLNQSLDALSEIELIGSNMTALPNTASKSRAMVETIQMFNDERPSSSATNYIRLNNVKQSRYLSPATFRTADADMQNRAPHPAHDLEVAAGA